MREMREMREMRDLGVGQYSGRVTVEIVQRNAEVRKRRVKTWTDDEDHRLIQFYQQHPKKWGTIAALMGDRNQNQLSQQTAHKKVWSLQEDHSILTMVRSLGKNWKAISEMLGTKTGKQIRERFINKLDPRIKTDEWTDEEDLLIIKYYAEVGSKWSVISQKLPGRPENKIKNRFYSFIKKNYDIKYTKAGEDTPLSQKEEDNDDLKERERLDEKVCQTKPECIERERRISVTSMGKNKKCEQDQLVSYNKIEVRSLLRLEEELMENIHKNIMIRDITSNNDIENDLFYLSNE